MRLTVRVTQQGGPLPWAVTFTFPGNPREFLAHFATQNEAQDFATRFANIHRTPSEAGTVDSGSG